MKPFFSTDWVPKLDPLKSREGWLMFVSVRWFRVAALSLLVLGFVAIGLFAQPAKPKKVALVVGVNKYSHAALNKPNPLEFAEADVTDLAKELKAGGYDEVVMLTGANATRENIIKKLDALRKLPGDGGVFLVALAGHGLQPGDATDAYFCPYDADQRVVPKNDSNPSDPWDYATTLPLADVLSYLKASSASTRVLMVDACRNDPASGRGRGVGAGLKIGDLPDNTAVLLSCSRGQRAFEHKNFGKGHGAFFHHVLLGMQEKGRDKKGRVTADSLWEYVRDAVPDAVAAEMKGAEQKPFRLITGDVDLQLVKRLDLDKFTVTTKEKIRVKEVAYKDEIDKNKEIKKVAYWVDVEKEINIVSTMLDIGDEKMVFVRVKAGKFLMGSPKDERDRPKDEGPQREVEITADFCLGAYEVTQAQYKAVMGTTPSKFKGDQLPVEQVSWDDAVAFCEALSKKLGHPAMLPTEAQWEYACRAGTETPFYFGPLLNGSAANCDGTRPYGTDDKGTDKQKTTDVGSYTPNVWGLNDMCGNVWEWCRDYYGPYDKLDGRRDPFQFIKQDDNRRVLRGGSWVDAAKNCRAAKRMDAAPDYSSHTTGFRVCLPAN